jgi:hypothetical protein
MDHHHRHHHTKHAPTPTQRDNKLNNKHAYAGQIE